MNITSKTALLIMVFSIDNGENQRAVENISAPLRLKLSVEYWFDAVNIFSARYVVEPFFIVAVSALFKADLYPRPPFLTFLVMSPQNTREKKRQETQFIPPMRWWLQNITPGA